jgi:hypothetical protein
MELLPVNHKVVTKLLIIRHYFEGKQNRGYCLALDRNGGIIYQCVTLELPYFNNAQNISCISTGLYSATILHHPKFGYCAKVHDVVGRSGIFMHTGNYHADIQGCVLVGETFADINKDGLIDVFGSVKAMRILVHILNPTFLIEIK